MKRASILTGIFCLCSCFLTQIQAQFIRGNEFHLPVVANEIAFLQLDTAKTLNQEDFYTLTKQWLHQNYDVSKYKLDDPKKGHLTAEVHFKIDDQHIAEPLYYNALVTIDFKNEVIRFKLHQLNYEKGVPKGKAKSKTGNFVDVTAQVKDQVRAGTDKLYPHTWDSLNDYGQSLLGSFSQYINEGATNQL